MSDNRAERVIELFAIGQKNFLLTDTHREAKGSAIMPSRIQTAIECGLNPYRYLSWLMKIANNADDLLL